jgi:uncharacterized protein YjbI with pentapeptide repeats
VRGRVSPSWSCRFIGLRLKSVSFEDSLFEECYFEDVTSSNTFFRNCTFINTVFYNTGKVASGGPGDFDEGRRLPCPLASCSQAESALEPWGCLLATTSDLGNIMGIFLGSTL